ncbi:MAG: hypothetical protein JWP44_5247 [Mucilaginibacter sp.]|nr:hypothetical protein [Mucilaginibacter sp.]
MKNLKSIMLGLALLMVCSAAMADKPRPGILTKNHAINTYIDAMTRGKLSGVNDILDQNATFSTLRGKQVLSFGKQDMLKYLKENKDIDMDCTTNTSVIQSNADITLVKVDMKYETAVRCSYITLVNTGEGWKITNVYSVIR